MEQYIVLDWFWNLHGKWIPFAISGFMTITTLCFTKRYHADALLIIYFMVGIPIIPLAWLLLALTPVITIGVMLGFFLIDKLLSSITPVDREEK